MDRSMAAPSRRRLATLIGLAVVAAALYGATLLRFGAMLAEGR
jgi:hypothetical protein